MTNFRIDTHKKSGEVTLWMETDSGFQLIIGWDGIEGVKQFATMLMNYYEQRQDKEDEENKIIEISNNLLKQALGEDEQY